MSRVSLSLIIFFISLSIKCWAQSDSTIQALENIHSRYLSNIDHKIDQYNSRITGKTEKTLIKLSRWENKIKSLLEQVSPETATKLFANNQLTFSGALKKFQEGTAIVTNYRAMYDEYRDKLTTSIKYLEEQKDNVDRKIIKPLNNTKKKLEDLEKDVASTEAVEQFIKERKKQLLNEAAKYLGKSKYLTKIDKEAYYYLETLRNYKELFSDKKKAEEVALRILNKIPAFKKFMEQNSMLASMFRMPTGAAAVRNQAGLQTRASIDAMIRERIGTRGPNVQQSLDRGEAELSKLKTEILKTGGSSSDANIPDFRPNMQKTKTFAQRLEYGSTLQLAKNSSYLPSTLDIGITVGFKLNERSIIGIGATYKLGVGSIQHIQLSHQGIGVKSFVDWKLKKQFFITGGYELMYANTFKDFSILKQYDRWQQAGLVGITKKIKIKTKFMKGTCIQLLYDVLYRTHMPVSHPIVFRIGYSFKN